MIRADAVRSFASGAPVVLYDEQHGAEPPTLVISAPSVTAEQMAFMVRHTCGFVTVALPAARCDALGLPAFAVGPSGLGRPIAAVSVDASENVSTGISAADRSYTARLLADPATHVDDLKRPGHLVPVRVYEWQRETHRSNAEAALALCDLAGVDRSAVCCELVHDESGELLTASEAAAFALRHGLAMLSFSALEVPAAA